MTRAAPRQVEASYRRRRHRHHLRAATATTARSLLTGASRDQHLPPTANLRLRITPTESLCTAFKQIKLRALRLSQSLCPCSDPFIVDRSPSSSAS